MQKQQAKPTQVTQQLPADVQKRLTELEGFLELTSQRFGYATARKLKQKEMNEKTTAEAKKAREISSSIVEQTEKLIKTPTEAIAKLIVTKREDLKEARKVLKDARKPYVEKITPLGKAVKYCDNVAIPDSLKELGKPVVPRFKLDEWIEKALAQAEKEKKKD